jgi:hypothetical protein
MQRISSWKSLAGFLQQIPMGGFLQQIPMGGFLQQILMGDFSNQFLQEDFSTFLQGAYLGKFPGKIIQRSIEVYSAIDPFMSIYKVLFSTVCHTSYLGSKCGLAGMISFLGLVFFLTMRRKRDKWQEEDGEENEREHKREGIPS